MAFPRCGQSEHIAARPRALRMLDDKETGTKRIVGFSFKRVRCLPTALPLPFVLSGDVGTSRPEEQLLVETTRSDAHPKRLISPQGAQAQRNHSVPLTEHHF
jgi:hypothetical protein